MQKQHTTFGTVASRLRLRCCLIECRGTSVLCLVLSLPDETLSAKTLVCSVQCLPKYKHSRCVCYIVANVD